LEGQKKPQKKKEKEKAEEMAQREVVLQIRERKVREAEERQAKLNFDRNLEVGTSEVVNNGNVEWVVGEQLSSSSGVAANPIAFPRPTAKTFDFRNDHPKEEIGRMTNAEIVKLLRSADIPDGRKSNGVSKNAPREELIDKALTVAIPFLKTKRAVPLVSASSPNRNRLEASKSGRVYLAPARNLD
jgi:hypothetical protein